jgi:hypothetical protein
VTITSWHNFVTATALAVADCGHAPVTEKCQHQLVDMAPGRLYALVNVLLPLKHPTFRRLPTNQLASESWRLSPFVSPKSFPLRWMTIVTVTPRLANLHLIIKIMSWDLINKFNKTQYCEGSQGEHVLCCINCGSSPECWMPWYGFDNILLFTLLITLVIS